MGYLVFVETNVNYRGTLDNVGHGYYSSTISPQCFRVSCPFQLLDCSAIRSSTRVRKYEQIKYEAQAQGRCARRVVRR